MEFRFYGCIFVVVVPAPKLQRTPGQPGIS